MPAGVAFRFRCYFAVVARSGVETLFNQRRECIDGAITRSGGLKSTRLSLRDSLLGVRDLHAEYVAGDTVDDLSSEAGQSQA